MRQTLGIILLGIFLVIPIQSQAKIIVREVTLADDFSTAKIKESDLIQGCFAKDCIPSIDHPKFIPASKAKWLKKDDIVFTIKHKGMVRAYPQKILNWHEFVNDKIGDYYFTISFCPLCGSAVGFIPKVNGILTQFGVSGKLIHSDLVMYDRMEGNLWQQITGEAIVGPAAKRNEKLEFIPIGTALWGDWKKQYPNTWVLSKDTGFDRDYERYPYGTYRKNSELYFGIKNTNSTLPIKEMVYGVSLGKYSKAYPQKLFESKKIIQDKLGPHNITLEKLPSGAIKIYYSKTKKEIVGVRLFWFAWAAFYPETEIYNE